MRGRTAALVAGADAPGSTLAIALPSPSVTHSNPSGPAAIPSGGTSGGAVRSRPWPAGEAIGYSATAPEALTSPTAPSPGSVNQIEPSAAAATRVGVGPPSPTGRPPGLGTGN